MSVYKMFKGNHKNGIKVIAENQNVNCKLSGIMAYCAPDTSSFETIKPYVDHIINCFGSDKVVWGSDWPVVNLAKGIQEWISVTRKILNSMSDDEAESIANGNAQRIYKATL